MSVGIQWHLEGRVRHGLYVVHETNKGTIGVSIADARTDAWLNGTVEQIGAVIAELQATLAEAQAEMAQEAEVTA